MLGKTSPNEWEKDNVRKMRLARRNLRLWQNWVQVSVKDWDFCEKKMKPFGEKMVLGKTSRVIGNCSQQWVYLQGKVQFNDRYFYGE